MEEKNTSKWETKANNIIYNLKNDFNLTDDDIPQKKKIWVPESVVWLSRDVDDEYPECGQEHGTVFSHPDDRVVWEKSEDGPSHDIISIDDMIDVLQEAKKKFGGDARLQFESNFDEQSNYRVNGYDTWDYEVSAWHKVDETWEAYYKRLMKLYNDLVDKQHKKTIEDQKIKRFLPDIDIDSLTQSKRIQIIAGINNIINATKQ